MIECMVEELSDDCIGIIAKTGNGLKSIELPAHQFDFPVLSSADDDARAADEAKLAMGLYVVLCCFDLCGCFHAELA